LTAPIIGDEPFEKVEIYSLTSTARIATYVFPGAAEGEFTLNGGAALHFRFGDRVAVVAYRQEESFSGANCVIVDPLDNSIVETLRYRTAFRTVLAPRDSSNRNGSAREDKGRPQDVLSTAKAN
jgi:aspartate 1-decarboxylase